MNKYFVDDDAITEEDTGDFLSIICRNIAQHACVLDVGCAQGKLGKKLVSKQCRLIGIDINKASVSYVRKKGHYTEAFLCDVSDNENGAFSHVRDLGPYDVIVMGDVLEHLSDPTQVLLSLIPMLKQGGCFIVSIPNIANVDICLNLLNGRFNYNTMGILDNTHLKFFTRSSFIEWIDLFNTTYPKNKLYCSCLGATYYSSEYIQTIENKYPKLASVLAARPESDAFQLIFRLNKQANASEVEEESPFFDCVGQLGDLLEGKQDKAQEALLSKSERQGLKELIKKKDEWIASQQEQVEYLNKVVAEKDEHIRQCKEVIKTNNEAIAAKDEWIAAQQEQEDYLNRVAAEKDKRIRQYAEVIKTRDEAIEAKDEWIASQQEQVEYLNKVVAERNEHIRQYEEVVKTRNEAIAAKDDWIAAQQEQVEYLNNVVAEKDEHIRQYEDVVKIRDEAITAKDDWIAAQQEKEDYLNKVAAEKDEHIRQCEEAVKTRDDTIAEKDKWILTQEEQIQYLQSELATSKENNVLYAAELESARKELNELHQRILDIENTWIWKHTKNLHKGI